MNLSVVFAILLGATAAGCSAAFGGGTYPSSDPLLDTAQRKCELQLVPQYNECSERMQWFEDPEITPEQARLYLESSRESLSTLEETTCRNFSKDLEPAHRCISRMEERVEALEAEARVRRARAKGAAEQLRNDPELQELVEQRIQAWEEKRMAEAERDHYPHSGDGVTRSDHDSNVKRSIRLAQELTKRINSILLEAGVDPRDAKYFGLE